MSRINLFSPLAYDFKRSLFEIVVWLTIYALFGYYGFSDPLFIRTEPIVPIAFVSVITLFYGIHAALFLTVLYGGVLYAFYTPFPLEHLLKMVILVFVWGVFSFYWIYHLRHAQHERDIYKRRLRELGHAFYALKVSHDQLELNYVLRPVSLRKTLETIKSCFETNEEGCFGTFETVLKKRFGIDRMQLLWRQGEWYGVRNEDGSLQPVDDDPLITQALRRREPVHVARHSTLKTRYLALIPALDEEGNVEGMVAIEHIPFLQFNQDTLIFIAFVFQYAVDEYARSRASHTLEGWEMCDATFRYELGRAWRLYKRYQIESTLLCFYCDTELASYRIRRYFEKHRRILDHVTSFRDPKGFTVVFLLPFNALATADTILDRLETSLGSDAMNVSKRNRFLWQDCIWRNKRCRSVSDDADQCSGSDTKHGLVVGYPRIAFGGFGAYGDGDA